MKEKFVYVVDMDDTLLLTRILNNDAYNYALNQFGYSKLLGTKRITRECIFKLHRKSAKNIVHLKQQYFMSDWMTYRICLNKELLKLIKRIGKSNCILWTSADKERAKKLIAFYNLENVFCEIIFDPKNALSESIKTIKKISPANHAIFFDDRQDIATCNDNVQLTRIGRLNYSKFDIGLWVAPLY